MANADSQFRISVHLPVNRPKRTPFTELTKAKLDFRFWCAQVTAEGDEIVRQKQRARSLRRKTSRSSKLGVWSLRRKTWARPTLSSPHARLAHSSMASWMAQWLLPHSHLLWGSFSSLSPVASVTCSQHLSLPPSLQLDFLVSICFLGFCPILCSFWGLT